MKVTEIAVEGFGVWSDLTLPEMTAPMTVVYGRNEAGKTTIMNFLRTILYGLTPARRKYLPPVHGGPSGGHLTVDSVHGAFRIARHVELATPEPTSRRGRDVIGPPTIARENLVIRDHAGIVQPDSLLGVLLAGVDEAIYSNVFAIGLRELQELATLADTDAAEKLYKLTSGLDRVSLIDVMRELESSRRGIVGTGETGTLRDLIRRRTQLAGEIHELAQGGRRHGTLTRERELVDETEKKLLAEVAAHRGRLALLETCLHVRENWNNRVRVEEHLARLRPLPRMSDEAIPRLDRLADVIRQRQSHLKSSLDQRERLGHEIDALPINPRLCGRACRIEALGEHTQWLTSLRAQIDRLRAEIAQIEREASRHDGAVSLPGGIKLSSIPDLSSKTVTALRSPALHVKEAETRVKALESDVAVARQELEDAAIELETELANRDKTDLAMSLTAAGERAAHIRRRMQLDERLGKMQTDRQTLVGEAEALLDEQMLPVAKLVLLGVPFVVGAMMILGGVLWTATAATNLGIVVAALGAIGLVAAIVLKLSVERTGQREYDATQRQLERVTLGLKQAKQEIEELDAILGTSALPLAQRLADAEAEIADLETLLPLDARRQAAASRRETMESRLAEAEEELAKASHRWRDALEEQGLPDGLNIRHIKFLTGRSEAMLALQRRLESRQEEFDVAQRELRGLTARIDQHLAELGLTPSADDPLQRLQYLLTELAQQRELTDRKAALTKQRKELAIEARKHKASLVRLGHRRMAWFASVGAKDETDYRKMAERLATARRLEGERAELTHRIAAILGGTHTEEQVTAEFVEDAGAKLSDRREETHRSLVAVEAKLSSLHEKRGELANELRLLCADRRLDRAQLERSILERRIRSEIARWQVYGTAGAILESVREIYETERQPQTLAEASRYLQQITRGSYQRIWTPMGGEILRVDDEHGKAFSLEQLSEGTREAIFLCLRLSLASAYARRGTRLPLVLDDVLVNLDADRAERTAAVLGDFARQGYQVLMFTCHEHILRMFEDLDADVRVLPRNERVGQVVSRWYRPLEQPEPLPLIVSEEVIVPEPEPIEAPVVGEPAEPVVAEAPPEPEPRPEVKPVELFTGELRLAPPVEIARDPVVLPVVELPVVPVAPKPVPKPPEPEPELSLEPAPEPKPEPPRVRRIERQRMIPAGFFVPADWEELAEAVSPLDEAASRALADRPLTERIETVVEEIVETADGRPLSASVVTSQSSTSPTGRDVRIVADADADERLLRPDAAEAQPVRRRKGRSSSAKSQPAKTSSGTSASASESRSGGRFGLESSSARTKPDRPVIAETDERQSEDDGDASSGIVFTWSRPDVVYETEDVA